MAGKWTVKNLGDRMIWHYVSNNADEWFKKTVWDIVSPNQGEFEHTLPEYAGSVRILSISGYKGAKYEVRPIEVVLWAKRGGKAGAITSSEDFMAILPKYVSDKVRKILIESWDCYKKGKRLP